MKPYYQDDAVTLYHADCRDVLPLLDPVDLVLADPPYNAGKNYGTASDSLSESDYTALMSAIIGECLPLASSQAWVAPRYQLHLWLGLLPKAHLIIVRRGATGPFRGG
jgi:DNA modification methylase